MEKVNQLGGKVVTLSDSSGTIYDSNGIDDDKLKFVMNLKNNRRGRIKEYADKYNTEYLEGKRPRHIKCDEAIPSATQNEISADDAKKLIISHIGSNNYQGGLLAGESMIKGTGGRGKIAILSFPEITSCKFRDNGFRDILKENNSRLQIVTELSARGNRNDGFNVANDILQVHPDIVGIFAINDPSALGAFAAIQKARKVEQITIVGFDASPSGKQAVFEKKIYDSPQQFPRKMATGTVEAFIAYLEGREVSKKNFIDCKHYYYNDSIKDPNRVKEQW